MIRKILIFTALLMGVVINAQEATYSPYSIHGLGLTKFRGTVGNLSMAGLTIISDPVTSNVLNAATYAELKGTNLSVGGSYSSATLKSSNAESKGTAASFDYLTISIPTDKFGFGFGLLPITASGYRINQVVSEGKESQIGKGGVNRFYFGVGATVYGGLKLGAELRYNFGRIENEVTLLKNNSSESSVRSINQSDISGISYELSAIYDFKIEEKYNLRYSIAYEFSNKINSENNQLKTEVSTRADGFINSTGDPKNIEIADRRFKLPSKFTFGLAYSMQSVWLMAGEIYFGDNNDYQDRFKKRNSISYVNPFGLKFGGYFQPNYQSLTSYFEKIIYRGGVRFERTGLKFNDEKINEFGISFGLGLPLREGYSSIDFGFELGKRGTTNGGAIQENFLNFSVGLSLSDKWFKKRKYD